MSFPRRITLDLTQFRQAGLEEVASRLPHESDRELVTVTISRGILAILENELGPEAPDQIVERLRAKRRMQERRSPESSFDSKLTLHAQSIDSNPVPFGMTQSIRQQHAQDAEHDKEAARMRRELGLADDHEGHAKNGPHHDHVERYVGAPISRALRLRLEKFLEDHPGVGLEDAVALLLQQALDQEEHHVQSGVHGPKEKKASRMVRLAEKLHARAARRCS